MKRSEMNDLVMKAHSEGVFVEDVIEEAYQMGRKDAIKEVIKITWEFAEEINTFETYRNEVLKELEQIKEQNDSSTVN